jgi:tetratricopeptide (TPR) repeat protein
MSLHGELSVKSWPIYAQTRLTEDAIKQSKKEQVEAIERTGNAMIASQIASTAVLHRDFEKLGYVVETRLDGVSKGLGAVSRQIGQMGAAMNMGFARLESAVQKSSEEVCRRLDKISDFLQNKNQTEAREYYTRALTNYNKGFYTEALKYINEALQIINEDYISWFLMGKIYLFGAGEFSVVVDLDKAINALEQAEKYIRPDSRTIAEAKLLASEILFYLAMAKEIKAYNLLYDGNEKESVKLLPMATQNYSASYTCSESMLDAKYNEARCYIAMKNTGEAIKCLEVIIKKDPLYSLKVALDSDFNSIQSDFTRLMEKLRSELYPKAQELWSTYPQTAAVAKKWGISVNPPEVVRSLGDIDTVPRGTPYLDMVEFYNQLSEFLNELNVKIAKAVADEQERIRLENEEKKRIILQCFDSAYSLIKDGKSYESPNYIEEITKILITLPSSYNAQDILQNALSLFNRVKPEITSGKHSFEFSILSRVFESIAKMLRAFPASYNTQDILNECENCRQRCVEQKARYLKKEKTIKFLLCSVLFIFGAPVGALIGLFVGDGIGETFGAIVGIVVGLIVTGSLGIIIGKTGETGGAVIGAIGGVLWVGGVFAVLQADINGGLLFLLIIVGGVLGFFAGRKVGDKVAFF